MQTENELTRYLEDIYTEITPRNFYRGIFPPGELDQADAFTPGKYTAVIVEVTGTRKDNGRQRVKRWTVTDDLDAVEAATLTDHFCICSPVSYAGKSRTAEHARMLYAIAIDLDRIRMEPNRRTGIPTGMQDLFHQFDTGYLPRPTYIVSSGTGLHLYYLLDHAIPLYRDYAFELQDLKRALTKKIWNGYIVDIKNDTEIQQEGIYQGFRMPGTVTKKGDRARAFLTGERVTLEYLNSFVSEMSKAKRAEKHRKRSVKLEEAETLYPDWYERRIIQGKPRGKWAVNRAVYDNWKRRITTEAKTGHRYYCLMMLAVYAQKCGLYDADKNPDPVTREELEDDCFSLLETMEALTTEEDNHFTEADILAALEAYDERWTTYPRASIEYRSGITIQANKRNGRSQETHLKIARATENILYPAGEWRENNGRKKKAYIVQDWRRNNPDGRKIQCYRETGLSRVTIDKYWNTPENIVL